MHLESPEHPARNLRDFLRQYVMIVVSILTALALEQAAVGIHRHQGAATARTAMAAELKANVAELRKALAANQKVMLQSATLYKEFLTAAKASSEVDQLDALGRPAAVGLNVPSLRSDAWASAIASQAINSLSAEELRRYSERYTMQKDVMQAVSNHILYSDLLAQLAVVRFSVDTGHVVNTPEVGKALLRYASVVQEVNSQLAQLLAVLESPA